MTSSARIDFDVEVPMRDGVVLRADVYRPEGAGPWPVIVTRTPYGKSDPIEALYLEPLLAVQRGLIAVVQDVRGRFSSEGDEWQPLVWEAQDGVDTIEWAARLEDSSGEVGMWGPSYMGNAQWQAASSTPAALGAIAPSITFRTTDDGFSGRGGARELGLVRSWCIATGFDSVVRQHAGDESALGLAVAGLVDAFDHMPGSTFDELPTQVDPIIARHGLPSLDGRGDTADVSSLQPTVDVPVLNVGGWFDIFIQGTLDNHTHAGGPSALIVGPWNHISFASQQGDINFGAAGLGAAVDLGDSLNGITFDWLRDRLGGAPEPAEPPVRIFVMGANIWRVEEAWPLERAEPTRWHLAPEGALSPVVAAPSPEAAWVDHFEYDPARPVPTLGGATLLPHLAAGSFDQAVVERRADVLSYTSQVLLDDMEVTGQVIVTLDVCTDAPTTDWVVRLCDVHDDGRSFNVVDGIVRSVQRAGEFGTVVVDLWSTSMVFKKGHRLRVQITSSCFPRWDRNLNTVDGFESGQMRTAHQCVRVGAGSYITLPVIPGTV